MTVWVRIAAALTAPLLLAGCLLAPGKFMSTFTVNADRSFTFTYQGEVHAVGEPNMAGADKAPDEKKKAEQEARNRAIAEALTKEAGYRSVRYVGDGKFLIDYRIAGTLTHNFTFPFNADAQAVLPFVVAELRANGTVRVKAPGFAAASRETGQLTDMPGMDANSAKLDGTFVVDTDAEIVSTNNEDGPADTGGRKTLGWRATPLTREAPTVVLRPR